MPPFPPKSSYPASKPTSKSAIDYFSGGSDESPLHGKIQDLVGEFGIDAVRQALDECEMGGESSEAPGEGAEGEE